MASEPPQLGRLVLFQGRLGTIGDEKRMACLIWTSVAQFELTWSSMLVLPANWATTRVLVVGGK